MLKAAFNYSFQSRKINIKAKNVGRINIGTNDTYINK